ncbi:hypothetical protein [Nocardia amamiensis]|uniref:hypothetical protein n=1 Tax=Nocardia amamiensis TaxID=404578 RepID=UPI000A645E67|nr:hypothetical protein [Nocardia amamiensis]
MSTYLANPGNADPDDALGYGYFVGTREPGPYDGFGEPVCPTMELAGGWWWLDYC